ncbi:MAG TPA: pyridoxamine 5'-phosphate oxidase family protein, partial [Acidimicrobiales bacterium]
MADDPHNTHRSYESPPLRRDDLAADPITQFTAWHEAWLASDPYEPAAMTVSTVNPDGWPSSRYVLCRGVDERGFVFYTNQTSRKA